MSTLEEIKSAVRGLSIEELAAFRAWFAQLDAAAWDRQIEADVAAGRLDELADEALEELRSRLDELADEALEELRKGRCTDR